MADRVVYTPVRAPGPGWTWALVALMGGVLLLMLYLVGNTVWGAANLRYTLTEQHLVVRYGYKLEQIDRAAITDSFQLEPTRGRRVGGTGLRRLQQGWYTFAETGRIKLYSTTTRPLTVLETRSGKWGISPAEPEAFLKALAESRTGTFEPVPGAFTFANLAFLLIVGGLAGILVPAGVILLMITVRRGSRILSYTLDQQGIEIRIAWSRVRLSYAQIESVEIASPRGFPFRTFGTSMPGLFWGSFAWKQAGPGLRLYATRYKPLVLIRTGKATYGVTPEEDERFVADLRTRIV